MQIDACTITHKSKLYYGPFAVVQTRLASGKREKIQFTQAYFGVEMGFPELEKFSKLVFVKSLPDTRSKRTDEVALKECRRPLDKMNVFCEIPFFYFVFGQCHLRYRAEVHVFITDDLSGLYRRQSIVHIFQGTIYRHGRRNLTRTKN